MADPTRARLLRVCILAAAAAAFGIGAFVVPLFVAADPDDGSMWLLESIPGLAAAGGGPRETEALLAAAAVALFALVLAATTVLAVVVALRPGFARLPRALSGMAVILLVGAVGAALLVGAVSGAFGGRALPVSPAVLLAAAAGVSALIAGRSGRTTS